jgi:hypothetical protein
MMKSKHSRRRLDPLILLAVLVTLGVMLTSTAGAADSFLRKPSFTDLEDGDITLTGEERGRAAIHLSFMSPSALYGSSQSSFPVTGSTTTLPDVYFSLRLPW